MKTTKRIFKRTLVFLIVCLLITSGIAIYTLLKTEPPIFKGEILSDIPYSNTQTLDIYQPTKRVFQKSPVVIFIHGGAWIFGRKTSINFNRFNPAVNRLRNKGYTVISPSYTLATDDKSPFPDCINDVYKAINWVNAVADSLELDQNNLTLFGESAGAHLALMAAFDAQLPNIDFKRPRFNCIVDVYGPTDLNLIYQNEVLDSVNRWMNKLPDALLPAHDITSYLFGFDPKVDSLKTFAFMEKYSPLSYLINSQVAPVLIIQGAEDQVVPQIQSLVLKKRLDSLSISNELHILPQVNHAFIGATDAQKQQVQDWIVSFIVRNTKSELAIPEEN